MYDPSPAHQPGQGPKPKQALGLGLTASDYAIQKAVARELKRAGRPEQAARLARCGQESKLKDLETGEVVFARQPDCGLSICRICGRPRASHRVRAQMAKVERLQLLDQQQRKALAKMLPGIWSAFAATKMAVHGLGVGKGRSTEARQHLNLRIRELLNLVRPLKGLGVVTGPVRFVLKATRVAGFPDKPTLLANLNVARTCLEFEIGLRLRYGWWAFSITKTTCTESYRAEVMAVKKTDFKEILACQFAAPGVGLIAVVHLHGNPNIQALYFGPPPDEETLHHNWKLITRDLDRITVEPVNDIEGWLSHMNSPPEEVTPKRLVAHFQETRGLQLVAYYGLLNPRSLQKAHRGVISMDSQGQAGILHEN